MPDLPLCAMSFTRIPKDQRERDHNLGPVVRREREQRGNIRADWQYDHAEKGRWGGRQDDSNGIIGKRRVREFHLICLSCFTFNRSVILVASTLPRVDLLIFFTSQ